jgi:2'-5' RNA ligase
LTTNAQSVRTFVALELEEQVRQGLATLMTSLRPRFPEARWVRPEGIHLTLRFLGDTPPEKIERLQPALESAASACEPSDATIGGLGTFPGRGRPPRVLWVGLELPPPVLTLQRACERAAVGAGFPPEDRPFHGHLTLARFRGRISRPALPPVNLGTTRLDTLVLFRSELRTVGAVYTPISRFSLGGGHWTGSE